MRLSKKK